MRSKMTISGLLPLAIAFALSGMTGIANAGNSYVGEYRDSVYADSFGNLVVHSRGGYKRIVVSGGHLAKELSSYELGGRTDGGGYADDRVSSAAGCYRPPYLVKGRSYMYGFDEGEIPFQGGPCR